MSRKINIMLPSALKDKNYNYRELSKIIDQIRRAIKDIQVELQRLEDNKANK